ncbi:MAG: pseudaminic acid cytidylyltransferase [Opitutae bacterium]|nr:pseudaminic acid cytidylyltransferase [Opitutae bacterium]
MKNLCVIPARGGSKRIPRKNIRLFAGKPMIAHSIVAARDSGLFERVMVSTDDEEIAAIARDFGAETPFVRPAELANDHAATIPVIAHALRWAHERGWTGQFACCLYATAPFVQVADLQAGFERLRNGSWSYVFTATDYAAPVHRAFLASPQGGVEMLFPQHFGTRSQDLPVALHDAGQFYWGRTEAWFAGAPFFAPHSSPLLLPRWRVQDIDTTEDWERAERMHAQYFSPSVA